MTDQHLSSLSGTARQGALPPTATYRLQLHAGFTFDDAAAAVPYLADLGVSHLYLSPILAATPGSMHGYDVEDHSAVNPELGGRPALERLVGRCRAHGLGVVVDVVPNHMALTAPQWRNLPLWTVLRDGPTAATASWFDIDWREGKLGLPILGEPLEQAIDSGALRVDIGADDEGPAAGQPVLRYYETVLPVSGIGTGARAGAGRGAGDNRDELSQVLAAQHYRLADWHDAAEVLNYRRFFEVDGLIAVRVEDRDVFDATHALLLELHHAGLIDGFRIDHPDGLADPGGYLAMLADRLAPQTPIWVEKILHGAGRHEWLPSHWACAGTTGYDATAVLLEAFTDPVTTATLDEAWALTGEPADFGVEEQQAKGEAVDDLLGAEMVRLTDLAQRSLGPGAPLGSPAPSELRAALRALLVASDAYRIYLDPALEPGEDESAALRAMAQRARVAAPHLGEIITALIDLLGRPLAATASGTAAQRAAAVDLAVRFQQVTGPVMAKGIEDTAFYRWHRLVARNEVGADPAAPAGVEALHAWARHQQRHWPQGMTTLSTHDTKRSEDARARVLAVAGHPEHWRRLSAAFATAADERGVDRPTAHLLWQTLVAVQDIPDERLSAYLTKAMRESRRHTSWVAVDEAYEGAVQALARSAREDERLAAPLRAALDEAAADIITLTLAQKAVQLTLPGVPDTYQGCELLDLSLVDPDNRRPVDFVDRRARLARILAEVPDARSDPSEPRAPAPDPSDRKLALTHALVTLRRDRPALFSGEYFPIEAGPVALGFGYRDGAVVLAVRAPAALRAAASGSLPQTPLPGDRLSGDRLPGAREVHVPAGDWVDVLSGREVAAGQHPVGELLGQHTPALVLVPRSSEAIS